MLLQAIFFTVLFGMFCATFLISFWMLGKDDKKK